MAKIKSPGTVEVYRDSKREWRWRAWRKGRNVANSGEGYKRRSTAVMSAHLHGPVGYQLVVKDKDNKR